MVIENYFLRNYLIISLFCSTIFMIIIIYKIQRVKNMILEVWLYNIYAYNKLRCKVNKFFNIITKKKKVDKKVPLYCTVQVSRGSQ